MSSVAAPVFGLNWRLLGSICISGPTSRLTKVKLEGAREDRDRRRKPIVVRVGSRKVGSDTGGGVALASLSGRRGKEHV